MNLMQLYHMAQQSQNPFALMRQFAGNDQSKLNFINNLEKQTPQQWEQTARNLAQSKGTTINQIFNPLGMNIQ